MPRLKGVSSSQCRTRGISTRLDRCCENCTFDSSGAHGTSAVPESKLISDCLIYLTGGCLPCHTAKLKRELQTRAGCLHLILILAPLHRGGNHCDASHFEVEKGGDKRGKRQAEPYMYTERVEERTKDLLFWTENGRETPCINRTRGVESEVCMVCV